MARRLLIVAGLLAAAAAIGAPRSSLAWHMAEHVVLLLVAPLSLALATRRRFEAWRAWMIAMLIAFAAHTAAMVVWHLPGPFDAAVGHDALHAVEHLSMLGTGYAFWAVLLASPQLAAAVPVLFVAALPGSALGAVMTLSATPWYRSAPTLDGQQVAGVVMWGFGGLVYVLAAAAMFGAWLASLEGRGVVV